MHQAHFIIPDPNSFPSGGNVYNASLMEAVAKTGIHVSHDVFHPEWTLSSPDTTYILDTYYFENILTPATQIPTRCIGLIHHLNSLYPISEAHFNAQERPILERMSGYIASSRYTQNYLVAHGLEPEHISLVEPAPSITRQARSAPERKVRALMLGSCIPRKGLLPFLEALAAASITPYYSLTIAGSLNADPVYAQKCTATILNDVRLKKCVHILGEQDQATIQSLYDKANLFLSASYMETFGMAIQDAVVSGLPVLALEGGYAAEHIAHGINGYRCDTPDLLVQAFKQCVTDSDNFLSLQETSMTYVPHYQSWDHGAATLIRKWLNDS